MKLATRLAASLVLAAVVTLGFGRAALAIPPLCEDVCGLSAPCNRICWGPGSNGFGEVMTCRKFGDCDRNVAPAVEDACATPSASTEAAPTARVASNEMDEILARLRTFWVG
jgi:hypothetical protein